MGKSIYSRETIICPYCQTIQAVNPSIYESNHIRTCDQCDLKFDLVATIIKAWTTSQNCELNLKQHNWGKEYTKTISTEKKGILKSIDCVDCLDCGKINILR